MISLKDVKTLAVKDAGFRKSLFANVDATLRQRNLVLNDYDLATLKRDISKLLTSRTSSEIEAFFTKTENPLGW